MDWLDQVMTLTFCILRDGMVILLRDGVEITNFGSHCRCSPTGQQTPCFFDFQCAFDCVKQVCKEGDDFVLGLTGLSAQIVSAYKRTFQSVIDSQGRVRIPDEMCD